MGMQAISQLGPKFGGLVQLAVVRGFRVDGQKLALRYLENNPALLAKMETLIFNPAALEELKLKAERIQFIGQGRGENPVAAEAIFEQIVDNQRCKSCTLCITSCHHDVLADNGLGKPLQAEFQIQLSEQQPLPAGTSLEKQLIFSQILERQQLCAGEELCGLCVKACPEDAVLVRLKDKTPLAATIYALLPEPAIEKDSAQLYEYQLITPNPIRKDDDFVQKDLAGFYPLFEIRGEWRHFTDSKDQVGNLEVWSDENNHTREIVKAAIKIIYENLDQIPQLKKGNYDLAKIIDRVINEILLRKRKANPNLNLLGEIINSAYLWLPFAGAKTRPIAGNLPPGTSVEWPTPYGRLVPRYARPQNCWGPECGICISICAEGGGGETSAIKMVPEVPLGTIPSIVRGLGTFLLDLGSAQTYADLKDLTKASSFRLEVNPVYCKGCGLCATGCPQGVIDLVHRGE